MKIGTESSKRQQKNSGTTQGVSRRVAVLEALSLQKGQAVLDIDCGGGPLVQNFSLAVGSSEKAYGIDARVSQVQLAQERCTHLFNVDIFCGGAEAIDLPSGSCHAISSIQI